MSFDHDIHALLERSLDGDLDRAESDEVARRLQQDPALRAHVESVRELRNLLRLRFDAAARDVDWASIHEHVHAAVAGDAQDHAAVSGGARDAELEMMTMAWADGELDSEQDVQRVEAYLRAHPEAADAASGLKELRDLARMPFERAQEQVDFAAMSERVMDAIDADDRVAESTRSAQVPASTRRSMGAVILDWLKAPGTGVAAFAGAAVAVAVLLPILLDRGAKDASTQPAPVVNNYYLGAPQVESVRYDQGYWGAFSPGDDMSAPVVWIQQEDPDSIDAKPASDDAPGAPNASQPSQPTQPTNDRGI